MTLCAAEGTSLPLCWLTKEQRNTEVAVGTSGLHAVPNERDATKLDAACLVSRQRSTRMCRVQTCF